MALVAAKAAHWSAPRLNRQSLSEWGRDLSASAYADVFFALGVFVVAESLLAAASRWPRVRRALYRGLVAFGAIGVIYAVASVQIDAPG